MNESRGGRRRRTGDRRPATGIDARRPFRTSRFLQPAAAFFSFLLLAVALLACGGGPKVVKQVEQKGLPPANPIAVAKMVQGVGAAKEPNGRDRAIGLLKEAVALDPHLWEAMFDLGVVYASAGDLQNAEAQLKAAYKLAPEAEDVAVALAEVRRRRGEHKDAADGLEDFLKEHPNATDARTIYVVALRDSGQVDKAIAQARDVLARKPGEASALAELALCHLAKGEKDTAMLLVRQAVEASPKSAVAHRALGLVHLANGDDAAAFQAFTKAAQEDPRDTTSRQNMGVVLLRAGAYARAAEQFREILKVSAEDETATIGLAAALRGEAGTGDKQHTAKLDEAKTMLEKLLARDPHNVAALFNLGVLYNDFLKKPDAAKPMFMRFLDDAPGDHPARGEAERYLGGAKGK
jgi:tetratricopeptide (TPR) repeat protein